MNENTAGTAPVPRLISIACAAAAMAAGAMVLLGWALDVGSFKSLLPGTVSMKANTALGFLAAGLSLLSFNSGGRTGNTAARRLARVLAAFTALLGLATLCQYLLGWNLGIDQLLFAEPAGAAATEIPGRMAPATAADFILFGLALALLELERFAWLGQALALLMGLSGLAALLGYAYGIEELEAMLFFVSYTKMAAHTALAFTVLSVGLVCLRPAEGLAAYFAAGGRLKTGLFAILAAGFALPVAGHMFLSLFYAHAVWIQAPCHTAVETMNSVTALLIAWLVYWLLEDEKLAPGYSLVPPALTAIGLLTGLHACVNSGNASVWLCTAAVVLGGFLLALPWPAGRGRPRRAHFLAFAAGVAVLGAYLVLRAGGLPRLFADGGFTRTARLLNTAGGLFFLAAAARFARNYLRGLRLEDQLLAIFCLLKAWAGALFCFTGLYGMDWWYWHGLRLAAHCVLLSYLFIVFRNMAAREKVLEIARLAYEESSRAKSAFLSNMSHELRTPLNSIIGFSEVLEDGTFGPLTEKQRKYVRNILDSGRGLLSLINDILSLSKIDSGEAGLEPENLRLADLLADCVLLFKEKAARHKIRLFLDTTALGGAGEAQADKLKLKQVMVNLLSNALKFTPEGGTVAVKAAAAGGGFYEVSVADTGAGIKAGNMKYLFSPFCGLEPVYTKNYSGTGIGLALVQKLVEMHGGAIRAESSEGKGSKFTFTIPVKRG